jgi:phosphoglycolate phosphatase
MPDDNRTELVVTDVDNTIFDWVGIWAHAFQALIAELARRTGSTPSACLAACRDVHLRRGATECPGLLEDLASHDALPGLDTPTLSRVAEVYRRSWDVRLAPYRGVRETLASLAGRGIAVVAYTESDASVAAARLTRMGLAGVIRRVFGRAASTAATRPDWNLVQACSRSPIAVDFIAVQDSKPNPLGLRQILSRLAIPPDRTLYLGDNLWKDVAMAQRLGVNALWAAYGCERQPRHLELLNHVAHWAAHDLSAERAATPESVRPYATLARADDLLEHVSSVAAAMA